MKKKTNRRYGSLRHLRIVEGRICEQMSLILPNLLGPGLVVAGENTPPNRGRCERRCCGTMGVITVPIKSPSHSLTHFVKQDRWVESGSARIRCRLRSLALNQ